LSFTLMDGIQDLPDSCSEHVTLLPLPLWQAGRRILKAMRPECKMTAAGNIAVPW
jgi:hypothetical protein